MPQKTLHPCVVTDKAILNGEPVIAGTRTSVRGIVEFWKMGKSPEEIVVSLPHLNLAQVFDALSFYQDNKPLINDYIAKNQIPDDLIHPSVRD